MTVSSTTNRVSYTGNGTANPLAVAFPFQAQADLKVVKTVTATGVQTTLVLNSDYTVTGTPDAQGFYTSGGNVVPAATVPNTVTWTIYRDPPLTQAVQHVDNDPIPAASIDNPVDKLTMIAQRTRELTTRSLRLPDGEAALDMTIPSLATRKGKLLGFDPTTGAPSIAVDPSGSAAAAAASAVAAAASAASAAADLASVEVIAAGVSSGGWRSFFDLISDATIKAGITAGTYHTGLDSYFATAIAAGGSWYFPPGTYYLDSKVTMAAGVEFHGAGKGNTTFFLSPGGDWGMELCNANSTLQIQGFKLYDMTIQIAGGGNGIRWNSASGGFTDDNTSQAYMMCARMERVEVLCDFSYPHAYTGVQMNKTFDAAIVDCNISAWNVGVHLKGSDLNRIEHNRITVTKDASIWIESVTTFGSTNRICHNDILQPGSSGDASSSALVTSDRDGYFCQNYIEGFASVTDAIQINGGFNHKVNDNRIEWDNATNVLRVRTAAISSKQLYGLEFCNNHTTDQMGDIVWEGAAGYYFTNSAKRAYIRIRDNTGRDNLVPFKSIDDDGQTPGYHAFYTPGRKGVAVAGISTDLQCAGGFFTLAANADTSKYIEFSNAADDETFPANVLKVNALIEICAYSPTAGQVLSWEVFDGGSSVSSGTMTLTAANRMFAELIVDPSNNFTSDCKIRVWNADTTRNDIVAIKSVGVKYDNA